MESMIEMYVSSISKNQVTLKMTNNSKKNTILIPTSLIPDSIKDHILTSPKFFKLSENNIHIVKTVDCPVRNLEGKFIRDKNNKIMLTTMPVIEDDTLIAPISDENNQYKINNQLIKIKEKPTNKLLYFMDFLDGFIIKKESDYSLIQSSFLTLNVPISFFKNSVKKDEIVLI